MKNKKENFIAQQSEFYKQHQLALKSREKFYLGNLISEKINAELLEIFPYHSERKKLYSFLNPTMTDWSGLHAIMAQELALDRVELKFKSVHHQSENQNRDVKIYMSLVKYKMRRQTLVALSTCESELEEMCEAAKSTIHVVNVLGVLGLRPTCLPTILCDNQSAVSLVNSEHVNSTARSRHFAIKGQFVRELILSSTLEVKYVSTSDNVADI